MPRSTVYRWLNPEYAQRQLVTSRNLKRRYGGICSDCGKTTPYNGHRGPRRCRACDLLNRHRNKRWTQATVVEAIQRWHAQHGRRPVASDWVRSGPDHPAVTTIYNGRNPIFPSWGAALKAAGYKDVRTGPGPGKQLFDRDEARQLRDQGLANTEIAAHFGVSPSAIYLALGRRSRPPKPQLQGVVTREQRIEALRRALATQ